jgi:hypothetical protein
MIKQNEVITGSILSHIACLDTYLLIIDRVQRLSDDRLFFTGQMIFKRNGEPASDYFHVALNPKEYYKWNFVKKSL